MTVPVPPGHGDYVGSATAAEHAAQTSGSSNPNDIWGLGDLYDKNVYTGNYPAPTSYRGTGDISVLNPLPNAGSGQTPAYGQTQDFMQHVVDLWAAQAEERKKFPNRLTTFEQLQRSLWQAGFYGQTPLDSVHVGQWTSQTQDALVGALGSYEQTTKGGKLPLTFSEFLNQNAQMGQDGGQSTSGSGGSSTKPPFQARLVDPAAIRQAAQTAALDALGQTLSGDQLEKFVTQFQAAQTSAEQTAYNGTGTVTEPDLTSQAQAFVQENNPGAYKQNQRSAYLGALVNLLGGTRPQVGTTPTATGGA